MPNDAWDERAASASGRAADGRAAARMILVGDHGAPEFAARMPAPDEAPRWSNLEAAIRAFDAPIERPTPASAGALWPPAAMLPPEFIVLLQRLPGEHSAANVERLRRLCPLSLWLVVLGPWSEGETRTGHPLAGMLRRYWHCLEPKWWREFARSGGPPPRRWLVSPLATPDEQALVYERAGSLAAPDPASCVALVTGSRETAEMLGDACRSWGASAEWLRPGLHPRSPSGRFDLVLWDPAGAQPASAEHELLVHTGEAPIVALLGFPRWQDALPAPALVALAGRPPHEALFGERIAAGRVLSGGLAVDQPHLAPIAERIAALIPKPFALDQLHEALRGALVGHGSRRAATRPD